MPLNEETEQFAEKIENAGEGDLLKKAMGDVVEKFSTFSPKIQKNIILETKAQMRRGAKYTDLLDYIHILVKKGDEVMKQFSDLTSADSDKIHTPKPTFFEQKMSKENEEAEEEAKRVVRERLKKFEEIYSESDHNGEKGEIDITKLPEPPKDWIH